MRKYEDWGYDDCMMRRVLPVARVAELGLGVLQQMVARPDGPALAAQQQAQLGGAEGAQAARREHGAEAAPERGRLPPHAAARHPARARLRVGARVRWAHLHTHHEHFIFAEEPNPNHFSARYYLVY